MAPHPPPTEPSLRLRFDAFELDEADARLTRDGAPVPLAPRPFAVLCALARTPRTLVQKNTLLDRVWGHRFVTESALKSTISELRAALRDDARAPRYIETVSRRGYRFIGSVAAAERRPDAPPDAPSPVAGPGPMIGRQDALERLREAWRLARAGRRQIVWIAGEAGVGKTTLIERFMAEAGDAHCAHGQCVEQYGAGEPYLPVLEALTACCRRDPALGEQVRAVAPTWLLQLPWLATAAEREALRRELAGAGQARMLREMGELLDRSTSEHPLLLVTEDLHWSDAGTIQLMDYLARRRGAMRLMWLASFRLTEIIAADHPLRALRHELRLHSLCEEIVLDPFSETEVAEYLARHLPALAGDEALARALHARTDGLPLFVAGLADDLAAQAQGGPSTAPAPLASTVIPESLTGIISGYVRELAAQQLALLQAASACGVEFRVATVAQVLADDNATVAEACVELARRRRWLAELPLAPQAAATDTAYAFRHSLYREVVYGQIGPLARVQLHRKVANALERERDGGRQVSAAELASHFELGGEPIAALRYYADAAEAALLSFSPSETLSLTRRAMALLPMVSEDDSRTALEITLATLQGAAAVRAAGLGSAEARRGFERALALLDRMPQHPLRALFLHGLGLTLLSRGEMAEAAELAARSDARWQASGDRAALVCACLVNGFAQHLQGRPRAACQWLAKGVTAAQALEADMPPAVFSADPGVMMLGMHAVELAQCGAIHQARERMRAAHERAAALREPGPHAAALWLEALMELRIGEVERVARVAERLGRLAEEHEFPQARSVHLFLGGWAEARLGDPRAAHARIREGHAQALRAGTRAWSSETLGYAAEALALAGDWRAAHGELEEAMRCAEELGERQYLTQLLLLDARIADALGEPGRAAQSLRKALAEARAQQAPWAELAALSALCESGRGRAEDVQALRRLLEETEGADTSAVARARALLAATA